MRKALGRPLVSVRACHLKLSFVKSFQFQRTKTFQAIIEKYTWLVYNRDDNLCNVESVQELST